MNLDVVFVAAASKPQRRGNDVIFAVGADISVATAEHNCNETPGMVVKEPFVVASMPLMHSD